jgi:hypothetical protein
MLKYVHMQTILFSKDTYFRSILFINLSVPKDI